MSKNPVSEFFPTKPKTTVNPEDIYTKLIINQSRRRQMYTYVFIAFCIFLTLVFNHSLTGKEWLLLVTPVLVIGGIVCLIPKSEEWEYRAWQTQPRQIERHQVERK
jgi:hypothetical protein